MYAREGIQQKECQCQRDDYERENFYPDSKERCGQLSVAACAPVMAGNNIGADMATAILLIIENVASRGTLPPSMPVMTGAAVAVGQNTHMNAPCATSVLNGLIARYMAMLPNICMERSSHESLVTLNSDGFTLQNVMRSITKMRYGARKAILSMKPWNRMPPSMAIGSIHGFII